MADKTLRLVHLSAQVENKLTFLSMMNLYIYDISGVNEHLYGGVSVHQRGAGDESFGDFERV